MDLTAHRRGDLAFRELGDIDAFDLAEID